MKKAFVESLCQHAASNSNILLVTGDLGFGVLTAFQKKFPNQFINAGICEQNMSTLAAALAHEGKTVFTYSIGNFNTLRCLEQIRNDICYHNTNVKIVSVGAGFSYGPMGITHHATEDLAIMRAIPRMNIFVPADSYETYEAMRIACAIPDPCYIRLGKGGEPDIHTEPIHLEYGKAIKIQDGINTAILACGSIIKEALDAAQKAAAQNISCAVYSFWCVKPIDSDLILEIAAQTKTIITLEEAQSAGGLGGAVAEVLCSKNTGARLIRLGLQDIFSAEIGSRAYLLRTYGLNAESIQKYIQGDNNEL